MYNVCINCTRIKDMKEAFQGVKATRDTALKTGDMGLSKHRQATRLNWQNTTATQKAL